MTAFTLTDIKNKGLSYVGSDKPWLEIKAKQEKVLTDHVRALDNGIKFTQKDVHGNNQLFFGLCSAHQR